MQGNSKVSEFSEFAVLGLALTGDDQTFAKILAQTTPEDFAIPALGILRTELSEFEHLGALDLSLLSSRLEAKGYLNQIITAPLLQALKDRACLPLALDEHIHMLRTMRGARAVEDASTTLATELNSRPLLEGGLSALVDESTQALNDALKDVGSDDWGLISSAFDGLGDREITETLPTGLASLDNILGGGVGLGRMTIIAARPGFGKSTLALDIARNVTVNLGIPALYVSLEMGRTELYSRFIAGIAEVSSRDIYRWVGLKAEDIERINQAKEATDNTPFYVHDSSISTPTLKSVFSKVNTAALAQFGQRLKLVIVDYVQLMSGVGKGYDTREREVAQLSRALKLLALQENVAVIAVSQLNRNSTRRNHNEGGAHYKPSVSDLRESGALEQDADVVMLLSLNEKNDLENARGAMDIDIAKQRSGPTGVIPVNFTSYLPRFDELGEEELSALTGDNGEEEKWD